MGRKRKDPNIKRNEFIVAARDLFFQSGYDQTSMQDVLKAVGGGTALSPSVFYYYFKSKDELFEAVIQDYMAQYLDEIGVILRCADFSYVKKIEKVMAICQKGADDFKKIDTYFDQINQRAGYFNYLIDSTSIETLKRPLMELLDNGIKDKFISITPLFEKAGTKIMAEIILQAIMPLSHQGRESDGQHHTEKYIDLLPLIICQFLGLPADTFQIEN